MLDHARDTAQLAPLLPSAGSPSAVMISSRSELLDLSAHWRCALPPLPSAHCVTVWHKMGVPPETDDLHQIAHRINGSALALGPVGTRLLRGASPAAILAALTGPDRYAAFPSLDAAEGTAFHSAYSALDTDLRNLIHQCAWHPGPDSLAAMAGRSEHEVEVRLTEIEQLLVRNNHRYSLHDNSLTYARQTAALHSALEEDQASRRRLYHHLHTGLSRARETLLTGAADDEQEVRWARQWLDTHTQELQVVARASSRDNWPQAAGFLQAVGTSFRLDNRYIEAHELFHIVLRTTSRTSLEHADATQELGGIHLLQGRYEEAAAAYQDALTTYQALGDRLGQASATQGLAEIHRMQGRYEEAAAAYQDALTTHQTLGDPLGQASATQGLADTHRMQGRYEEATAAYQDALTTHQTLGNPLGQTEATKGLADTHRMQGRYEEATAAYQDALTTYQALGDRLGQTEATKGLADTHRMQGRYEEATAAYQDALTTYQALGTPLGQAEATKGLADTHRMQDRHQAAMDGFRRAGHLYAAIGITDWADRCQKAFDELDSTGAH